MTTRVALRLFPSDDPEFAAFARSAFDALSDGAAPHDLQARLRERYPAAVVRGREEIASVAGPSMWYAFRYGSARGPGGAWWQEAGVASAVIDDERVFVAVDDALAAIIELPAEAIVGRRLEEFANPSDPTAIPDLLALWAEFRRSGVIESTIRFNFGDGRPRELAYRLVADTSGRHRVFVRVLHSAP